MKNSYRCYEEEWTGGFSSDNVDPETRQKQEILWNFLLGSFNSEVDFKDFIDTKLDELGRSR